jgi:tetratricopeptide (TPR) repeat protein
MVAWASNINPAAWPALIVAARKLVLLEPDRASGWLALGNLLMEMDRFEEAADVLSDGAARLPAEPKVHRLLADARQKIGEIDAALAAVETALSLAPHDQATILSRFDFFVYAGRWDRVAQDLDDVTTAAPTRRSVILAHAHFARGGGDPEALLAVCEAALAQQPGYTEALYYKAIALSMLGRDAEACAVIGLDSFVSLAKLPTCEEHIGGTDFLDALAEEILRNPTLVPDPHGKATRGGLQTRALMQVGDKAVPLLLEQIKLAVDRYVDALPALPHPFAIARPMRVNLHAWAVVYPQDGWQKSHLHPDGWISGVTYVTAPRIAGESKYRGPLVLGELNAEQYPHPPPWGVREVEPKPGWIVLFPSFVPHATRPSGLAEQRICVAFDVVRET